MGMGVIPWAFPFSMDLFEFGWIRKEETVYLIPLSIALLLPIDIATRMFQKRQTP